MIKCKLCNSEFSNNLRLKTHLLSYHQITIEEYVIITEYNEIPPKCKCEYCLENPRFNRGKFSKYAIGHKTFKFRESQYIKRFGKPTCFNCSIVTGFHRAIPKALCSECAKTNQYKDNKLEERIYNFQNPESQDKVKRTVMEKYGVDNISKVPEVANKIKETFNKNFHEPRVITEETRNRLSKASIKKWADPKFHEKTSALLKIACNKQEERERRSRVQKEKWKCMKNNFSENSLYKSSKLHKSIREELNLSAYGFLSEQIIHWYVADELHPEKKIIIEINGDFWHANPDKYSENDVIKAPGEAFVAGDKWKKDVEKYKKYMELGYELIVIWESDYKEDKTLSSYKEQLTQLFGF